MSTAFKRLVPGGVKRAVKGLLGLHPLHERMRAAEHRLNRAEAAQQEFVPVVEELRQLRTALAGLEQAAARSNFLHDFAVGRNVDLVDFGDVRLLMFMNDNLYQLFIPEHRKCFPWARHYAEQAAGRIPSHPLAAGGADAVDDPRFAPELLLLHLFRHGVAFTLFDIGAFVGDFAVRMASFARSLGRTCRAVCFDPSLAGSLIPHNIALNRLEAMVRHENCAVSTVTGPLLFSQGHGHADSGALDLADWKTYRYVVSSTTAADYVRQHALDTHLIFKIDTEGYEQDIVQDIWSNLGREHTFLLEFSPTQIAQKGGAPLAFLEDLERDYHLFDLYYLGCPTRADRLGRERFVTFVEECGRRRYGFTDLLAFPKALAGAQQLADRLGALRARPDRYTLIAD